MKVKILNVNILSISKQDLLKSDLRGVIFTPNVDHLMKLQKDKDFYESYKNADYVLCDSRIIYMLSHILKKRISEPITGSDFFPAFCKYHGKKSGDKKVFLLGGTTKEILESAISGINSYSDGIVIGGYSPPFGFEKDENEISKILGYINSSKANVLAVGLGAPKQELFISKYRGSLKYIELYFAIGATIDFESKMVDRSPRWMTKVGMEWLFRMIKDPKRLGRRYLIDDMPFFYLFFKQLLGIYSDPFEDKRNYKID